MEIEYGSEEWQEAFKKSKFKDKPNFTRSPGPILLQDHGDDVKFRKLMDTE